MLNLKKIKKSKKLIRPKSHFIVGLVCQSMLMKIVSAFESGLVAVCFHTVWIIFNLRNLSPNQKWRCRIRYSHQISWGRFSFMWKMEYAFDSMLDDCDNETVYVCACKSSNFTRYHQRWRLINFQCLFQQFLKYTRNKFKSGFAAGNVRGWRQYTDSRNCIVLRICCRVGTSVCTKIKDWSEPISTMWNRLKA